MSVKTQHPPVIVTGMHRSGTSLVASMLSALSIRMGQQMLAPDSNNVRGYFEDLEFLQLQRTILSASCASDDGGHPDWGWTESETLEPASIEKFKPEASALVAARSERSSPWGWKDPRTALLLDFWEELLDDPRYVFVYRFPWDVADSMQRLGAEVFLRNPEYSYRIWEYYNRHIRDFYIKHSDRCLLISTNALRRNQSRFISLISGKLGIPTQGANLGDIQQDDLLKTTVDPDPLINLVGAVWPASTSLLSELDEVADISADGLWRVGPVHSKLSRPDSEVESGSIDVSIVTPCYNQGAFLIDAIASVERFAPNGCELIVVNDGSDHPRTLEILDILKGCGYFILDQPNLGLSAARNSAISLARGRYVLPLDDDNRIRSGFIEEAMQILDSSPAVGIVYGDRHEFGLRTGTYEIPDYDVTRMLKVNYIDACAVFRKQVWQECGGYDSEMSPMEDWELWINAANRGWRFHHLAYVTLDYRVRPGSLLSRFQSMDAPQEFRTKILRKHPGLPVDLAELYNTLDLLNCGLAAERQRVTALSAELEQAQAQVREKDNTIQLLSQDASAADRTIQSLSEQLSGREAELARIKVSSGWRLLQSYGRIKYRRLLPIYRMLGLMPKPDKVPDREFKTDGDGRPRSTARYPGRRGRPTLEVHLPISPTPTFLNMAHYLTRSLRARGGSYRDAPIVLTVGAERRDPDLISAHPWMKDNGVEVRWVDEGVFARESWLGTAAQRFTYDFTSDVVLMLDADTLIAGPLDELIDEAYQSGALCGVIAHVPPFPSGQDWQEVYDSLGLGQLVTPCEHTGWGYMFHDQSQRHCPPYFNLGVLAAPASVMRRIGGVIYDLMAAVQAIRPTSYRVQIGVSLAVTKLGLPFCTLPFRWNFANDPLLEALHAGELHDVRIIHLLRKHQLYKDELYSSLNSVETMLARTDLRVINALAQQLLREIHSEVKAEEERGPKV